MITNKKSRLNQLFSMIPQAKILQHFFLYLQTYIVHGIFLNQSSHHYASMQKLHGLMLKTQISLKQSETQTVQVQPLTALISTSLIIHLPTQRQTWQNGSLKPAGVFLKAKEQRRIFSIVHIPTPQILSVVHDSSIQTVHAEPLAELDFLQN